MFEHTDKARIFGMPIGADFAKELARGLIDSYDHRPPHELAKVEILVNTARMRRSLIEAFQTGAARLLPRIRLITDLTKDAHAGALLPVQSELRTKLHLSQLVRALLDKDETRGPKAALFDLTESLFRLLDEMKGEGVSLENIEQLDVTDQSGYWQNSLQFIRILGHFFAEDRAFDGADARLRQVVLHLADRWQSAPPSHPIIIAGSTGSRGATKLLMTAVAHLPQGALLLPGFDFDMDSAAWQGLDQEDHPQYRFKALLTDLDLQHSDVVAWPNAEIADPARNKLMSLALRPAPVTSNWISEGPSLGDLRTASKGLTLLEAESPRQEAETIALRMRKALDQGLKCALITPDRMLTRQVAAALDRWDLIADDSAGTPLILSAPGRMLCQIADCLGRDISAEVILSLLKHPLCNSGDGSRGNHLLNTRELELHLRKSGAAFPARSDLQVWASAKGSEDRVKWADWLATCLETLGAVRGGPLATLAEQHLKVTELMCAGPSETGSGGLWQKNAGREAKTACTALVADADAAGDVSLRDYRSIFRGILGSGVVRDRDEGHPDLLILGTLEARVQTADLVFLSGLNEGIWPEAFSPDPWLNRKLRKAAGLLLPDRQIGLSAHDFQQAAGAKEVWLTRSKRNAEAETVPSRWVNRLTNLMEGLTDQFGPDAIAEMRRKAEVWASNAKRLSTPSQALASSPRPSPCPPVEARPKSLSVTRIKTLIRDPYAIYAEKVLRLRPLNPIVMTADAPLRGVLFHEILEKFIHGKPDANDPQAKDALVAIAQMVLDKKCPWPAIRLRWLTQIEALSGTFVKDEAGRQTQARVLGLELRGRAMLPNMAFELTGVADRIDVTENGDAIIYDYKTGTVPTGPQQLSFDKQLLLEAAMVEQGAFKDIDPMPVADAQFISIKPDMKIVAAPLDKVPPDVVWQDLAKLIARWNSVERGYTARMAQESKDDVTPYDHLARYGEWDLGMQPQKIFL